MAALGQQQIQILDIVLVGFVLITIIIVVVVAGEHGARGSRTGVRTKLKTKCSPCAALGLTHMDLGIGHMRWPQDATAIGAKELNVWREQFDNR